MFANFLSSSVSFCYTTGFVYLKGLVKSSRVGTKGGLNLSQELLKVYGDLIFILVIRNKDLFSSLSWHHVECS